MPLVRPRLTDYHGILLAQSHADFAIPFFDEDIPLYLDPFLLAAVYRFRLDNTGDDDDGDPCWIIADELSDLPAGDPKDFKYQPK